MAAKLRAYFKKSFTENYRYEYINDEEKARMEEVIGIPFRNLAWLNANINQDQCHQILKRLNENSSSFPKNRPDL